jgi:hypothetical protein
MSTNWSTQYMIVRLLSSLPQKPSGITLEMTARQKADTWAVGHAMSVKVVCWIVRFLVTAMSLSPPFAGVVALYKSALGWSALFLQSGFGDNDTPCST